MHSPSLLTIVPLFFVQPALSPCPEMPLTLTSVLLGTSGGSAEGTGLECAMGRLESDKSCDVDVDCVGQTQ